MHLLLGHLLWVISAAFIISVGGVAMGVFSLEDFLENALL